MADEVNEEHGMTARAFGGANDPAVGSNMRCQIAFALRRFQTALAQVSISCKAVLIIVVADECERVPRLYSREKSWVDFWVTQEEVVKTCGEGIAQCAHLRVETGVFLSGEPRNLERMVKSIFVDRFLSVDFRQPSHSANEVLLDAPEVVLCLSIGEAEYGAGIGAAEDVRDAIRIAIDGYHFRDPR